MSRASITCLPMASPTARAVASASADEAWPATTSTSRMTGAGLKKCRPTTRSGCATGAASSVTESDEVLVASTQPAPTAAASAANSSCLSSSRSGAASMTMAHGASAATSADRLDAADDRLGLVGRDPAPGHRPLQRRGDALARRAQRLGHRVVQQRARAGLRGQLGDAQPHRAGADHADGLRDRHGGGAYQARFATARYGKDPGYESGGRRTARGAPLPDCDRRWYSAALLSDEDAACPACGGTLEAATAED